MMYKQLITFLYNNFTGVRVTKIGKYYASRPMASRYLFPSFVFWGIAKVIQESTQGNVSFAWWDILFIVLVMPQIIASFTMLVVNEYNKLNK